jgi:hypothetical protein
MDAECLLPRSQYVLTINVPTAFTLYNTVLQHTRFDAYVCGYLQG